MSLPTAKASKTHPKYLQHAPSTCCGLQIHHIVKAWWHSTVMQRKWQKTCPRHCVTTPREGIVRYFRPRWECLYIAPQRQSVVTTHMVKTELWLSANFAVTTKSRQKPSQTTVNAVTAHWLCSHRFVFSSFPSFDCRYCALSCKFWWNNF